MPFADELASLFQRDLTRLSQQLAAFAGTDLLWNRVPGIANSAGNLMLHLDGNLRDFVGRILGGIAYTRQREREFGATGIPHEELAASLDELARIIPEAVRGLSATQLAENYSQSPLNVPVTTQQFLMHLYGHLSYHLGQIDYLRRMLSSGKAVPYAQLAVERP